MNRRGRRIRKTLPQPDEQVAKLAQAALIQKAHHREIYDFRASAIVQSGWWGWVTLFQEFRIPRQLKSHIAGWQNNTFSKTPKQRKTKQTQFRTARAGLILTRVLRLLRLGHQILIERHLALRAPITSAPVKVYLALWRRLILFAARLVKCVDSCLLTWF